jgi:hypothetical protein
MNSWEVFDSEHSQNGEVLWPELIDAWQLSDAEGRLYFEECSIVRNGIHENLLASVHGYTVLSKSESVSPKRATKADNKFLQDYVRRKK